jgi:hypothetical protein
MSRTMTDWKPIYICYRPGTKSKASHARCRQYIHETGESLRKWLNARKNSLEWVRVEYCPTAAVCDTATFEGTRKELAAREEWPL